MPELTRLLYESRSERIGKLLGRDVVLIDVAVEVAEEVPEGVLFAVVDRLR